MSYFTRLREQSGLTVVNATVARDADPWSGTTPSTTAMAVTEVLESREVESEARHAIAGDVPVPPASAGRDVARMSRRPEQEPATDFVTYRSDPAAADPALRARTRRPEATPAAPQDHRAALDSPPAIESIDSTPFSRDTTLHHVFEWLAAPAQAVDPREQGVLPPREESAPRAPVAPTPAVRTIAMPPPRPMDPVQSPQHRALSASPIDVRQEEVVTLADERRPPGRATPALAIARSTESNVEEALTVSIGEIHLRVEAPSPAPVVAARPAAPARPARQERRPASRLSRHYLRP